MMRVGNYVSHLVSYRSLYIFSKLQTNLSTFIYSYSIKQ